MLVWVICIAVLVAVLVLGLIWGMMVIGEREDEARRQWYEDAQYRDWVDYRLELNGMEREEGTGLMPDQGRDAGSADA